MKQVVFEVDDSVGLGKVSVVVYPILPDEISDRYCQKYGQITFNVSPVICAGESLDWETVFDLSLPQAIQLCESITRFIEVLAKNPKTYC